jgi:hypothetical protein
MADIEELQDLVFSKLNAVDVLQLGECCVMLNQTIPPNKKGKKSAIRGILYAYLTSAEMADKDDEGKTVYEDLNVALDRMLGEKKEKAEAANKLTTEDTEATKSTETAAVKVEVTDDKVENNSLGSKDGSSSSGNNSAVTTKIDLTRIKEFKISPGTIGKQESMTLENYKSLCYQVQEAKELGYRSREIVAGVIKGMNQPLKGYFEGQSGITEESLMKMIRSICQVKDSTQLLEQMITSAQEPTENELSFMIRMMGLRDTILTLTKQESCSLGDELVRRKFLHSFAVGLRKDTVRLQFQLQFQNYYEDVNRSDHELMEKLRLVVDLDNESKSKTKPKQTTLSSVLNALSDEKNKEKEVDNAIIAEIRQLRTEVKAEVNEIKGQFNSLKMKVESNERGDGNAGGGGSGSSNGGGGGNAGRSRRKYCKCESCEERGVYCTHCSKCGESGHKRKDCTKNA